MCPSLAIAPAVALSPLDLPAWDSLLAGHSESCVFQTAAWARVLQETYGHRPFYFCRFAQERLESLLPVMEVSSPLTGRRGVALPFSDFCPALNASQTFDEDLVNNALEQGRKNGWRSLEFRGARPEKADAKPSVQFLSHVIDLKPGTETLFGRLDDTTRRGVRKGAKAGLQMEFSASVEAMEQFFSLHCRTRKRHGLPPQPFRFFRNIARHLLQKGQGFVATAFSENRPVASAVFLQHNGKALYKFGASDFTAQGMRPNNFLMWEAIKHCVGQGLVELHLGRTSLANAGLRRFKLGFGAAESTLHYYKYDFARQSFIRDVDRAENALNTVFRWMPLPILRLSGRLLYPHLS